MSQAQQPQQRKRARVPCMEEPFFRTMYRHIVSQLVHDGFTQAADAVAISTGVVVPNLREAAAANGRQLERIVANGMAVEHLSTQQKTLFDVEQCVERCVARAAMQSPECVADAKVRSAVGVQEAVVERFVTPSLGAVVRSLTFSADGRFLLCGASGGSVRLYAMHTLEASLHHADQRAANQIQGLSSARDLHTVTSSPITSINATKLAEARHYTQHKGGSVECMAFHPTEPATIASATFDGELLLWGAQAPFTTADQGTKLKHRDTFPIRSLAFDATGETILYATDHNVARVLHVETKKLFSTAIQPHTAALSSCAFSMGNGGRQFCTASYDGSIAVMDTSSTSMVCHLQKAHCGAPVTSCVFSKTGNVLLSCGLDGMPRLWDLRKSNAELMSFGEPDKSELRLKAAFDASERHIVAQDSATMLEKVQFFSVYSGQLVTECGVAGHKQRAMAVSGVANGVVATGGEDCRLRLWGLSLLQ